MGALFEAVKKIRVEKLLDYGLQESIVNKLKNESGYITLGQLFNLSKDRNRVDLVYKVDEKEYFEIYAAFLLLINAKKEKLMEKK